MLNSLFVERSPAEKQKLEAFIQSIVAPITDEQRADQATLIQLPDDKARIDFIWQMATQDGLNLSRVQCKAIYEAKTTVAQEIEAQVLALDGKKLDPKAKFVLQTTLMLAAIYLTPELFAFYTGKEMLKKCLSPFVSENKLKFADLGVTLGSQYLGYNKNQLTLIDQSLPEGIANLNLALRIPFHIAAQSLLNNALQPIKTVAAVASDEKFNEAAGDFFDIMYGRADDGVLAKYEGSFATKTPYEAGASIVSGVSSGLNWLWNKVPPFKAQKPTEQATVTSTPKLN